MTTETTAAVPRETSDPIEAARAEVRRLLEVELEWSAKRDELAASLPGLEASAGDAVLDGGDAGEISSRIATARVEVNTLDATIATARDRRREAIRRVFEQEAGALFAEAGAKRREADTRRARTNQLLAELESHEGVPYGPVQPDRPAVPDPSSLVAGASIQAVVVRRKASRSEGLVIEAEDLERRAVAERSVTQHGRVETDSVEDLIAEATADPMHIGPTVASMRAWADEGTRRIEAEIAKAQARLGDREAEAWGKGRPIRFEMYWAKGEIDARSSRAFAVPPEPVPVMTRHGLRYDRGDGAGLDPHR